MKNAVLRTEKNLFEFNTKVYDLPINKKGEELGYIGRVLIVTEWYTCDDHKELKQTTKEWRYTSSLGHDYNHTYRKTIK